MRAVDTNVLVRLVTRDDPRQVAAAETFVSPGAWVPHVVDGRTQVEQPMALAWGVRS